MSTTTRRQPTIPEIAGFRGRLIHPDHPDYDGARTVWNGVIDRRLARSRYIAGPAYGIADMATFPWLRGAKNQGVEMADFPHLKGWFDEIAARPAVMRAVEVLAEKRRPLVDDKAREMLFGNTQYDRR